MVHFVYCDDKEKILEKILDGSKTMIIRAAAGRKIPHSRVFDGEKLYFMKKGTAKISATATVKLVRNHVKLSDDEIGVHVGACFTVPFIHYSFLLSI